MWKSRQLERSIEAQTQVLASILDRIEALETVPSPVLQLDAIRREITDLREDQRLLMAWVVVVG